MKRFLFVVLSIMFIGAIAHAEHERGNGGNDCPIKEDTCTPN